MSDELKPDLLAALEAAVAEGSTIPTVSNGRPNRVHRISATGALIATEKSEGEGRPPQLVPAWMIQSAWDHLVSQESLTNEYLLSPDGLNVKRSSAVCALLAQLPDVQVVSSRPIKLRYTGQYEIDSASRSRPSE